MDAGHARPPRPSLTRPSSCTSAWASTPATPTSRSAAPSCCPTAPARPSACWCSPRATRPTTAQEAGADYRRRRGSGRRRSRARTGSISTSVIATPDMMGVVGRLGKRARPQGPDAQPQGRHRHPGRGQAPSPRPRPVRSSTAWTRPTSSTAPSARSPSAPRSCRRTCDTLMDAIIKAKPAAAKGTYIKSLRARHHHGPRHPRELCQDALIRLNAGVISDDARLQALFHPVMGSF